MKKLLIALLVTALLLCSTALGEYRPATASPTPPPNGWVRGTITDVANSSTRLSNVTVKADGKTVYSDAQGNYEMELKPGTYTFSFEKNGYVKTTATVKVLPARETRQDCSLLKDLGWVSGVVTDASARLSGVKIYVQDSNGATVSSNVQTDAQGQYKLELKPGTYTLTFEKNGYSKVTKTAKVKAGSTSQLDVAMTAAMIKVHGVVSDATDPSIKLSGVTVTVDGVKTTTNSRGEYEIQVSAGTKTITFKKDGYIDATETVQANAGQTVQRNCSMSRKLSSNQYRVVLTWGSQPNDLDSHLLGTSSNGVRYHVYFSNKRPDNIRNEADLDVDDRYREGPETTTFKVTTDDTYVFYVKDFTNGGNSTILRKSDAKVEVYCGDQHLQTFTVPYVNGGYWEVFRIQNKVFKPVNKVYTQEPSR